MARSCKLNKNNAFNAMDHYEILMSELEKEKYNFHFGKLNTTWTSDIGNNWYWTQFHIKLQQQF